MSLAVTMSPAMPLTPTSACVGRAAAPAGDPQRVVAVGVQAVEIEHVLERRQRRRFGGTGEAIAEHVHQRGIGSGERVHKPPIAGIVVSVGRIIFAA